MLTIALSAHEQAVHGGANRLTVLTHADLTQATANTVQAILIAVLAAGEGMRVVKGELITPFKDASDAAFNTTPIIIGDAGDDDRLMRSVELNENGSELNILFPSVPPAATYAAPSAMPAAISGGESPTEAEHNSLRTALDSVRTQLIALAADADGLRARLAAGAHLYTSATDVNVTFGSMSGKALVDIDVGEVHIYWTLFRTVAP